MRRIISIIIGNKTYKETAWSLLTKASALVLFLLLNIILARGLGKEQFGLWSLFLSIITAYMTLSLFGINSSAQRFLAENKDKVNGVLHSGIRLRIVFSLAFALLLLLLAGPIASIFHRPELQPLLMWGSPLVFLSGLVEFTKSAFMGLHRIRFNFLVNLSEYGLKAAIVAAMFLFSRELMLVVNSFMISLGITAALGIFLLHRHFMKGERSDHTRAILDYSYPFIFISLGFIALTEIDTMMLGILSTAEQVGVYSVAKQFVQKLPHLALAIAMGTMPVFAGLNETNKEQMRKKLMKLLKLTSGVYLVIIAFLLAFAPFIISMLFGKEYIAAALSLQILTVYLFCYVISIILSGFLDYTGRAKKRAFNMMLTIGANILLNIILIPKYGAAGASVATSISYIPYVIMNWLEANKALSRPDRP